MRLAVSLMTMALFWAKGVAAQSHCVILQDLADLHAAIVVLSSGADGEAEPAAISQIDRHSNGYDAENIGLDLLPAVGTSGAADLGNLVTVSVVISALWDNDQQAQGRAFVTNAATQDILSRTGETLRQSGCPEIVVASVPTHKATSSEGLSAWWAPDQPGSIIAIIKIAGSGIVAMSLGFLLGRMRRGPTIQRRANTRTPVNLSTLGDILGHHIGVHVLDISRSGARIQHDLAEPPKTDCAVRIHLAGSWINAKVRWSDDHFSGVQFDELLSLAVLDAALASPRLRDKFVA